MAHPDPSSFFRLNEEIAREIARLERSGALETLLGLLGDANVQLRVTSFRESEGLEEVLGTVAPRLEDAAPETAVDLGLSPVGPRLGGCSGNCGEVDEARAASVQEELARPRGGFSYEDTMTARSQFVVVYPDGEAREVYMPDHLCPSCWNAEKNVISECARICGRCGFEW
ncbi:MAG TPA: hypothetical protein VFF73_08920 [Planctomycetota bacterium]|nr:hypothetical protein [Planctomycetota bacterium]